MKKISIVVPTYNVEKYISKCLDSLVVQDYPNYDVLVINDGSPANEQVIINKYQLEYPEIIKGIKKENGGYGSVLELAFNESDADYILVCDPDDYLASNALSKLMSYMIDTDADLVVGAKNLVYSDNDEIKYDKSFNSDFGVLKDKKVYIKGKKEFESLYFLEPSPHSKLYKRELVSKIKFPHKVSYTDNLLYFYTLSNVTKVTYCEEPLSYYLINREGNTRTDLKPGIIDAWVTVFKEIVKQAKVDDILAYRLFESFYSIYYKVDQIKADEDVKLQKYDLIYTYLKELIPYKELILKKNSEYQKDNSVILKQKSSLLDRESSKKMYDSLVNRRLHGSLKDRVKNIVFNSDSLSKLYDKYHFHAKYFKTRNDEKIEISDNVTLTCLLDEGTNFFGYYDKPSILNNHSLLQRVNTSKMSELQMVDILLDNKKISETNTWNWQQGSMLMWFDEKHIMHNFFDGTFKSKIINIETKEERIIECPVYSLSKDKTFFLSLNFSRLAKLRPDYGYFNLPYNKLPDDKDDGIWIYDLKNDKKTLLISLEEIRSFESLESMHDAIHKVNHIDISPNSDKAIFLHRWYKNNVKHTRLICIDIKTKSMKVLANNEMVSHMAWINNNLVFGYLRGNDGADAYYFIDMEGKQERFAHPLLIDDGHPTVYKERYIVVDTYPDYTCKSKLYLIDTLKKDVTLLGKFYSYKKYQGTKRCDLHPRFTDTKQITFDSVAKGKRRAFVMNLEKLIKE